MRVKLLNFTPLIFCRVRCNYRDNHFRFNILKWSYDPIYLDKADTSPYSKAKYFCLDIGNAVLNLRIPLWIFNAALYVSGHAAPLFLVITCAVELLFNAEIEAAAVLGFLGGGLIYSLFTNVSWCREQVDSQEQFLRSWYDYFKEQGNKIINSVTNLASNVVKLFRGMSYRTDTGNAAQANANDNPVPAPAAQPAGYVYTKAASLLFNAKSNFSAAGNKVQQAAASTANFAYRNRPWA